MSGLDASAGRGRRSPWAWSGQVKQADSLLDELFEDLENSLEEGLSEAGEYPYLGTRPPLPSRRFSAAGGLLLGMALAATLVAGLAFWMTLRPRAVVFSQATRDPLAEAPNSSHSDAHQEPLLPTAADVDENPKAPPEDSAKAVLVEPAKPPTVAAPLASRGAGLPSPPQGTCASGASADPTPASAADEAGGIDPRSRCPQGSDLDRQRSTSGGCWPCGESRVAGYLHQPLRCEGEQWRSKRHLAVGTVAADLNHLDRDPCWVEQRLEGGRLD